MSLLIDVPRWPAHGRLWAHLVSDTSFAELHAFAGRVGLPPRSFEGDHYDVPAERYETVVAAGARPVSMRELVVALHASGLRRPKRKGERVLTSMLVPDAGTSPATRVDLLASTLPPPVAPARVEVLLLQRTRARTSLLVVRDGDAATSWSLPGTMPSPDADIEDAAALALQRQTGVRLDPTALRIGGHLRGMTARPTWTTFLTTTLVDDVPPAHDARWLSANDPAVLATASWWPLVGWLLDRRQPLTRG